MASSPAQDAMQYNGYGYVFGGTPAHNHQWDCSSFVNWVFGNDCGYAIPGFAAGSYHGQVHGPVVLDWASWSGATTIGGNSAGASDIVVWPGVGAVGHMGIVTGPNQMISALNTSRGTVKTPIQGYGVPGVTPVYRRVTGVPVGLTANIVSDPLSGCAQALGIPVLAYALFYRAQCRRDFSRRQRAYRKSVRQTN